MYKKLLLLFLIFCFSNHLIHAQAAKHEQSSFVVIELFTSQGCNTCPPADKLLSEVIADARKSHKPIYAMSFHVDYWNKLGWKDPFSSLAFTKRQNNYVSALKEAEVYTPQVFVNGKTSFVGSDKKKLLAEIDKELKSSSQISLTVTKDSLLRDTLFLKYTSSKADKNYSLVVAVVQRGIVTKVNKGENSGKTLGHDNVVRSFEIFPLNTVNGTAKISMKKLSLNNNFSLYAYVQQKQSKHILAATGFDF